MSKTTLLIDGDVLVYRAAYVAEENTDWGEGQWTVTADETRGKQKVDADIQQMLEDLDASAHMVALSDTKANWRKDVLATYKENRKSQRRPLLFKVLRAYLFEVYKAKQIPRLEADDLLGMFATGKKIKGRKIICTIDKDLRTIPGELFNPDKPELGVEKISLEDADYYHMLQTLTGDSVDNYAGCPTIGPKRAAAALEMDKWDNAAAWRAVVGQYEKKGLTEDDALQQARVARILRNGEFNLTKQEVKLWRPAA